MKGVNSIEWTMKDRIKLKELLNEGYNMSACARMMNLPKSAIRCEIKKSISDEHYSNGQYLKYDPIDAIEIQVQRYREKLQEEYKS